MDQVLVVVVVVVVVVLLPQYGIRSLLCGI
jgi:hypothetical protein